VQNLHLYTPTYPQNEEKNHFHKPLIFITLQYSKKGTVDK